MPWPYPRQPVDERVFIKQLVYARKGYVKGLLVILEDVFVRPRHIEVLSGVLLDIEGFSLKSFTDLKRLLVSLYPGFCSSAFFYPEALYI